jgi:RHS repeat-associated protein
VTETYEYDAFGNERQTDPFAYSGDYFDLSSGISTDGFTALFNAEKQTAAHPETGDPVTVLRLAPALPHAEVSTPYLELSTDTVYIPAFEYWTDAPGGYFYAGLYPDDLPSRFVLEPALTVQKARIEISSDNPNMGQCIARFVSFGGSGSVYVANVRFYNKEAVETWQLLDPRNAVSEKDFRYFINVEKVPMTNMATGRTDEVLVIPPIEHSGTWTEYMNLSRYEEYVLEFMYWGDDDGDIVITDLHPDDLPESCLTVLTSAQRARITISSDHASMSNAALRFFVNDGYGHSNTGKVYVSNIIFYKKADLGKAAENTNPYRYCGEYWDGETKTYYLRARYYSPTTGRFLSEDTFKGDIRDPLSLNLYTYCHNNPVLFIDPNGHYDREAATQYALKYSTNYNKDYLNMGSFWGVLEYFLLYGVNLGFADCTNFTSQALFAGGLGMDESWHYYKTINELYCSVGGTVSIYISPDGKMAQRGVEYDFTSTWSVARSQYEFFSNPDNGYIRGEVIEIRRVSQIANTAKYFGIKPGDLMYFASKDGVHHATMITKVTNTEIFFTAHTNNRKDYALGEALGDERVYIVRIRDDA